MHCIGFIGLGLIGGSLARSIRKVHPDIRITAFSRSPSTLELAMREKIIDEALSENDPRFAECDMIFLCAPVRTNISYFPFLARTVRPDCIVTDVGSVKGCVADAARDAGLSRQFIGGHPMAGSEKTGLENATDHLLENAWFFLTPSEDCPEEMVTAYRELVESIHAIPLILRPEEHDRIVAGVSHLPHLVAATLVNAVRTLDDRDEHMKLVAAGGFRDITRIASSSPEMWQQICLTNLEQIMDVLRAYIRLLEEDLDLIGRGDAEGLHALFSASRNYRDSLDDSRRGSVERQYLLYVDLYDEAGGIATVTTLLAMNGVNLKNIGILHNREFEEGVLRIEFYDRESCDRSAEILTRRNYVIRKKQ